MDPVLVNARYVGRPVTGVERVATEIVRHLTIEHRLVGSDWGRAVRGHLAEQTRPLLRPELRRGLLWSPANAGPVFHRNHVVTIHDVATLRHPEYFSARFRMAYRLLLSRLASSARAIVAPSSFTAHELTTSGLVDSRKVLVIRNGIDGLSLGSAGGPARSELDDIPDEYFLVVGSLDPRKNLDRLVSAYVEACASGPLPHLLIAGGSGEAFARKRLMSSPGVRYLGRVSDRDLVRLYSGATATINASVYEGFGLTVSEAAAFDAPMMVSDIPAHRELLSGDGSICWVDPWDVNQMSQGLRRLSSATRCAHVVTGHTWADAGSQYSDLFSSLRPQ